MLSKLNELENEEQDKTLEKERYQIDRVLTKEYAIIVIRGSKITDFEETFITKHRRFEFDIAFTKYFYLERSKCDNSSIRKLILANNK